MSNRIEKLNSSFKRDIAELLTKKVKDPRITEMFTVLEVDCDKELSTAKVYISVFSADEQKAAQTFWQFAKANPSSAGKFPARCTYAKCRNSVSCRIRPWRMVRK